MRACVTRVLSVAVLAAVMVRAADAASVKASVASREVFVGIPFNLSVEIDYADRYDPPALPEIDGLTLVGRGGPSESSVTQYSNQQLVVSRRTSTFVFQLVADRPGPIAIPAMSVTADGTRHVTAAIKLVATQTDTRDLLFVEVSTDRDTYYLGERVPARLEIWIRRFEDSALRVKFDERTMWARVDEGGSSVGAFAGQRAQARTEGRGGKTYYVYTMQADLFPQQTGPLRVNDVRIVVDYPMKVRERTVRSVFDFGGQYEIVEHDPLVGVVTETPATVIEPPPEGRPPWYSGAVGRFEFTTKATPTEVAVGDPITLTMHVLDRTPGGSALNALQAPRLDRVPELTDRFRMQNDPLAGVVKDTGKTFTQTIRATDDSVTEIPAIPLTYFDPQQRQYVTVRSAPIPVKVEPAVLVDLSQVVGADGPAAPPATELTEVTGGLLANATGPEVLAAQGLALGWRHVMLVLVPPLAVGVVALGQRRARRLSGDGAYARRQGALRRARLRLDEARRAPGSELAERTAAALGAYVADRCNLPPGAVTSAEVALRLRGAAVPQDLVEAITGLLESCEQARYAGGGAGNGADGVAACADRAANCIDRLARHRLS